MHTMFPDWLRTLSPDDTLAQLPVSEWWAGVESFVDDASADDIVDLARAASRQQSAEFDQRWREHLRKHDPVSPLRGQERQIAVLAGAALIYASEAGTYRGLASYARRCVIHAGWQPELLDVAFSDDDIAAAGTQARQLPAWPVPRKSPIAASAYSEEIPTEADDVVTAQVLTGILDSLATAVTDAIFRSSRAVMKTAQQREIRLIEQSDVLGWLLAGRCEDMDCDWESVSPVGAAVMAAAAVLDLSRFSVGRPDHAGLIGQAVDAAVAGQATADKLADTQRVLGRHGFTTSGSLADLQVTCTALHADEDVDAPTLQLGVRIHDELFLQREYGSK